MNKFKRKKYIINKKFQLSLLFKFLLLIIAIAGVLLITIELFFNKPYRFKAHGETVLIYKEIPEYIDNKLVASIRYSKKGNVIAWVKYLYKNKKLVSKKVLTPGGVELEREVYKYDRFRRKIECLYYKQSKFKRKSIFIYAGNNVVKELVYNKNNTQIKIGEYKYMRRNVSRLKSKNFLMTITYFKTDVDGRKTSWETDRWELSYDHEKKRVEIQYKRKDGLLYLLKKQQFKDRNFNVLEEEYIFEDKFTEQFEDFLFQPVYNKDGDIINLRHDPVNRYQLMTTPVILTSIFILVFVLVFGVFISHHMAGPIYRLKQFVDNIKNGFLGKSVKLRKHDDFKDLASDLNDLDDHILDNVKSLYTQIEIMEKAATLRGDKLKDVVSELTKVANNLYSRDN